MQSPIYVYDPQTEAEILGLAAIDPFKKKQAAFTAELLSIMELFRFKDGGYFNILETGSLELARELKDDLDLSPPVMEEIRDGARKTAELIATEFSAPWAQTLPDMSDEDAFIKAHAQLRLDMTDQIARLVEKYFPDLAERLNEAGAGRGKYSAILARNLVPEECIGDAEAHYEKRKQHYTNPIMWVGFALNRLMREGAVGTPWEEPLAPGYCRLALSNLYNHHRDEPNCFYPETLTIGVIKKDGRYVTGIIDAHRAITELLEESALTKADMAELMKPQFHSPLPCENTGKQSLKENRLVPLLFQSNGKYYMTNAVLTIPGDKGDQYRIIPSHEIVTNFLRYNREKGFDSNTLDRSGPALGKIFHKFAVQTQVIAVDDNRAEAAQPGMGYVLSRACLLTIVQHPLNPNHTYHWVATPPGGHEMNTRISYVITGEAKPHDLALKLFARIPFVNLLRRRLPQLVA
jgi:hypothetical protein